MEINSYMRNFFFSVLRQTSKSPAIILTILFFTTATGFRAQNLQPELRTVNVTTPYVTAGLYFKSIEKTSFDQLLEKINNLNQFDVKTDFIDQKNSGYISLKARNNSNLKDLQALFKLLGIQTVIYNGKSISSQEIEQNYKPVNDSEIKNIERKINYN